MSPIKKQYVIGTFLLLAVTFLGACQTPDPQRFNNNPLVKLDRSYDFYSQETKKFWRVHIQSGESGVIETVNSCYSNSTLKTPLQELYRCLVLDVTLTNFASSFSKAVGEEFGRDPQDITNIFTRKENMQERAYLAFYERGFGRHTINDEVEIISKKIAPIFASTYKEIDAEINSEKTLKPWEMDWSAKRLKPTEELSPKPTQAEESLSFEQKLLSSVSDNVKKEVVYQLALTNVFDKKEMNYADAVRLTRIAADDGSYTAQYNMGVYSENGRGVLQDDKEAIRWFTKSAEQGYPIAFASLARFYVTGIGVDESQPVAYALLSVASSYAKSSKNNIETIRNLRDKIARMLSPQELIAGQSLSQELIKKNNVEKSIKVFIARKNKDKSK